MESIYDLIRQKERDYTSGPKKLSKYVEFDQYENVNKIHAYLNSTHTSGEVDDMDREKPFLNVSIAARNIWYRATDRDRKTIKIKLKNSKRIILDYVATILLQDWMKEAKFGVFLNTWGRTLADYGSAIDEFVEQDGKLIAKVIPWIDVICDPIKFENNLFIKKIPMTPQELRANPNYDQKKVEALLTKLETRKMIGGQSQDNQTGYAMVYEAHGYLPVSYLTNKEKDEKKFDQQIHAVCFLEADKKGEWDEYTLYAGREDNPLGITHLIEEEGRTQAVGSVERMFTTQWMANHSVKAMKDQLDVASKMIFQTADATFVGQNVLSAIENGDILIHKPNQPLTHAPNVSHDIGAIMSFANLFINNGKEESATPDAMRGRTSPSGTPASLEGMHLNEGYSLFEIMTENKDLALEGRLREKIIPFIKKKMNTSKEISAILEANQITKIDSIYLPKEATKRSNLKIKHDILAGKIVTPEQQQASIQAETMALQGEMGEQENQRLFKPSDVSTKTWKELLKGYEWKVEFDMAEAQDKQAIYAALNAALQRIMAGVRNNPNGRLISDKMMAEEGAINPIELKPTAPQMAQVGVGSMPSVGTQQNAQRI